MALKHKLHDYVLDVTRGYYCKIVQISPLSSDDQEWCNHGAPSQPMYTLKLLDRSTMLTPCTHYLIVEELDELYPYIGTNVADIEVLYANILVRQE